MQRLLKLPLIFFFIASCLGLLLRWHYVQPIAGFKYPYWLHAHSHLMFLGWVFNALSIGFVSRLLPTSTYIRYTRIFVIINLLVACMLISFPLQGYGVVSIIVSTLHTVMVVWFSFRFFSDTKSTRNTHSVWFARTSLMFFIISAAGPFALGVLMANGLGQTQWYYLAVYYYLHFQYNGVFTFGALALFFGLLVDKGITPADHPVRMIKILLIISCFPAYVLSTLWTTPGAVFNAIGALAGGMQLVAFVYVVILVRSAWNEIKTKFSHQAYALLAIALIAFGVKFLLQFISAHPSVALLAYEVRFYVIAYLHLVLLGVSFFLLGWYFENGFIRSMRWRYLILLMVGFFLSELVMVGVTIFPTAQVPALLVGTSMLMVLGIGGLVWDALRNWNSTGRISSD